MNVGLGGGHGACPRYFVVSAERLRRIIYHVSPSCRSLSRTNTSQAVLIVEIATCVVDASSFLIEKTSVTSLRSTWKTAFEYGRNTWFPRAQNQSFPLFFFSFVLHPTPAQQICTLFLRHSSLTRLCPIQSSILELFNVRGLWLHRHTFIDMVPLSLAHQIFSSTSTGMPGVARKA